MMQPIRTFKRWQRDRLRDKIIAVGERRRRFEVLRAGVSADLYPHDAAYLDTEINRLTQRHEALLTKFKETA